MVTTEYTYRRVSDIQAGDTILTQADNGEVVPSKIRKIEKGWLSVPSVFLRFSDGEWICEPLSAEIAVA